MTGFVSFVSSGPGDPELLTLKAARRLAEAEVVLFDDLSAGPILGHVPASAEMVAVGKRAGKPSPKQSRICMEITAAALKGKRVVRLKSGDPSVFGRAAEEIEAARQCDIPVEIVPGITAACAAAASLCRPLTERGRARQVVFASATGQEVNDPCLPARLVPGSSYALYMAVHRLEALVQELLTEGLAPDTTVTVVAAASSQNEQMVECALSSLERDVRRNGLTNPAIIMFTVPLHLRGAATKARVTSAFA